MVVNHFIAIRQEKMFWRLSLLGVVVVASLSPMAKTTMLLNSDRSGFEHNYLRSRMMRSLPKLANTIFAKMESLLSGATELTINSNLHYKVFKKAGGTKQAMKDFEDFMPSSARYFSVSDRNEGVWGTTGDAMILLERYMDVGRATLIIKPNLGFAEDGMKTYRILYKDKPD